MTSRIMFLQKLAVFVATAIGLIAFVGCAAEPPPPPPPPPVVEAPSGPEPVEHTVRYSGETLGLISKWYTGDAANWNLIVDANPGLQPNRLNLGKVITIPGELVQKRDPLPKSVIPKVSAPVVKKPEEPAAESVAASEGDQPAPPTEAAAPPAPPAEAKAPPAEPSVDQLLEELANNAQGSAQQAAPPPPAPPVEASPDAPPAAPASGDAEREQLLDELLEQ